MIPQVRCIQPIGNGETIYSHEVVSNLWPYWTSPWFRNVGIVAVIDGQGRMMGILRPYDIVDYLLRQAPDVYHLWPYTHVIDKPWADRLKNLDNILVSELIRESGVVIHNPPVDWIPSVSLFAESQSPVIWISDPHHVLYGKVTLQSFISTAVQSSLSNG